MHNNLNLSSLRVRPRVGVGVLALLAYLAVFYTAFAVVGTDYLRLAESEDTLFRWVVIPLSLGFVVVVILVSAFGWWRPSLTEARRLPRWGLVIPGIMAAVAIVNMFFQDFSRITPTMWLLLVVIGLLVGFNEEVITRGQLVVALRSRFGETGVWFFSSLAFALLHLPNVFFGVGALAFAQVLIHFGTGSVFYLARRSSGSLVAAMILHGLYDVSILSSSFPFAGLVQPLISIAAVVVVMVLLRREKSSDLNQTPVLTH